MRAHAAGLGSMLLLLATSLQAASGAVVATLWWVWPAALFVACHLMGIVAVPAGIGGLAQKVIGMSEVPVRVCVKVSADAGARP